MEPLVTDNPQESRYEIHVAPATADADLPQLAGFAQYHRFKDEIAFIHTEIDPKFEGQGLGGKLARAALDDAREKGLAVLPFCPFIRGWMGKHPDYIALVPADQRARFGF
ncbi:GNAT family N-acetyltransferase [Streptacidiphilus monticola]|uniref:GNAT family N-acetyltransferase n=1 Tax=Streptacidiphilus monticola TaxID=2161674 RepID=A0ABW1G1I3_9ACTN